jgi:transcriptional regulator with XRE-family HTH domain
MKDNSKMGRKNEQGRGKHWQLADRFRQALAYAGLDTSTYAEIGKKLDLSAPAVGKLLNGQMTGSFDTIKDIAVLTNVNIEWLATGRGAMVYKIGGGPLNTEGMTENQLRTAQAILEAIKAGK